MVKVTLDESGIVVNLAHTPELLAEQVKFRDAKCDEHPVTEWRRFPTSNGSEQIRRQCLHCGHVLGGARRRQSGDELLAEIDQSLADRYQAVRDAEYHAIQQRHAKLQHEKQSSFFEDYSKYLQSDEWKAKRDKVIRRAKGICEGCGERSVYQVHHLTYAHKMNEFLFELVAVCRECHDRLHEPEIEPTADAQVEDDDDGYEPPCCDCRWADWHKNGERWCSQVEVSIADAMSHDGECGPSRRLLEGLK